MIPNWTTSVCAIALLVLIPGIGEASFISQGSGSVSGRVMDASGAAVAGAQVSLILNDGRPLETLTSGTQGEFSFVAVRPGSYRVTVAAAGFTPFSTKDFSITAVQAYSIPEISLSVSGVAAEVIVRPVEAIAAEQLEAAKTQRFGGFPNFYVSYIPDAAPLTTKQKFSLAARYTFDWASLGGVSIRAGLEQATNAHAEYGQGLAGYGKRAAALLAGDVSRDVTSHYVFASLLHQDPRYFYQGTGTKKARLFHALRSAVIARSDSGRPMPNYAYLFGDVTAAALSTVYYPRADRRANRVLTLAAYGVAVRAAQAVMREFMAKRPTSKVPAG